MMTTHPKQSDALSTDSPFLTVEIETTGEACTDISHPVGMADKKDAR